MCFDGSMIRKISIRRIVVVCAKHMDEEIRMGPNTNYETSRSNIYNPAEESDWKHYSWFCPNCGKKVGGYKDHKNRIKANCSKCGVKTIRTIAGRRHDIIDVFA